MAKKKEHPATRASRMQHERMSVKEAFHEVKHNKPRIVKHTEKKFGKADAKRQSTAIALSKAGKFKYR